MMKKGEGKTAEVKSLSRAIVARIYSTHGGMLKACPKTPGRE